MSTWWLDTPPGGDVDALIAAVSAHEVRDEMVCYRDLFPSILDPFVVATIPLGAEQFVRQTRGRPACICDP